MSDSVADAERRERELRGAHTPKEWLAYLERHHAEAGNPLCVWHAVLFCTAQGLPLPAFALSYLHDAAAGLTRITTDGSREQRMAAALDALALRPRTRGRKPDAFEEFAFSRDAAIVGLIELARSQGRKHDDARDLAMRVWGVSRSTADRAWRCRCQKSG